MVNKPIEISSTQRQVFDILFEAFEKYRKEIKCWPCPSKLDLEDWENFKLRISRGLQQKFVKKNTNDTI